MSRAQDKNLITRPPIVVVMGHIDHGKTKLLDYIRKTNVIEKEAGGITQSIGAYEAQVSTKEGESRRITFIDTPGHEAFSKMRSRGAKVADIAILVVAADDGVKPQTKEALSAIKEAGLPFVVVLNKIDKPDANAEKVKKELSENEIFIEEWGGKVPLVEISAKEGTNVEELLETLILIADLEDFRADPKQPAKGVVIESHRDPKRGNTATLVIRDGTLRLGSYIVAGNSFSPVRIFEDFLGHALSEASFSSPVLVVGFDILPEAGDDFRAVNNKKEAEKLAKEVGEKSKKEAPIKLSESVGESEEEEIKIITIPVIIKADTVGSLEVVKEEIKKFEKDDIIVKILKSDVGDINEDDMKTAISAKDPFVIGFAVGLEKNVAGIVETHNIEIKKFDIIYELVDWVKEMIEKRLPKQSKETVLGRARILKIFSKDGYKQVVGGVVLSGNIYEGKSFKLFRREKELKEGKILGLQHNKMKVKEVEKGKEFGSLVNAGVEIAPKDELEIFDKEVVERKL